MCVMIRRIDPSWPPNHSYPPYNPNVTHPMNTSYYYRRLTPFDVFAKPKQPMNWQPYPYYDKSFSQSSNSHNLLYYFQDTNGEMDLDKIFSTAGQVADTIKQVSPMVKQVGDFMNHFR